MLDRAGQRQCPECGLWVQRTPEGTLADGMAAHYRTAHPGELVREPFREAP